MTLAATRTRPARAINIVKPANGNREAGQECDELPNVLQRTIRCLTIAASSNAAARVTTETNKSQNYRGCRLQYQYSDRIARPENFA